MGRGEGEGRKRKGERCGVAWTALYVINRAPMTLRNIRLCRDKGKTNAAREYSQLAGSYVTLGYAEECFYFISHFRVEQSRFSGTGRSMRSNICRRERSIEMGDGLPKLEIFSCPCGGDCETV